MKLLYVFPLLAFLLFSCDEKPVNSGDDTEIPDEKLGMEELIKRKIVAELDIPATENYSFEIKRAQLNEDDFEDAIVLVNRKEHAIARSKEQGRQESDEKLGYVGNHNYLFYYDGMTHAVTRPIGVPSSALIPLELKFENIQTQAYSDFTIDLRIKESRWRNFYTVKNGVPKLVFQWNIQMKNEQGEMEVYHLAYDKGSYSLAKDILIYNGKLNGSLPEDLNSDYKINTTPTGDILYRFFYNPAEQKYFTNK